jgi:hypothetical protein
MRNLKKNLKKSGKLIKQEMRERTIGYILTGFSVVAGLAWNEAIKSLIENIFPMNSNSVIAKLVYALIMTFVVVVAAVYLVRIFKSEEAEKEKKEEIKE